MSFLLDPRNSNVVRATRRKEKVGQPEDARQEVKSMQDVLELPPVSKKAAPIKSESSPERRAAIWLDEQLRRAATGVISVEIELTPALATVLLNRNPDNRNVSDGFVERYSRDIENGSWAFNGQTIIVASDGFLNDGQHRCLSVEKAKKSIRTIIVIGVDRDTRYTLDQGRTRMASDYLSMQGYKNSTQLSAAGTYLWQYKNFGKLSSSPNFRPTKGEILSVVEEHPILDRAIHAANTKGADAVGGKAVLAFTYYLISRAAGPEDAKAFMAALISGESLSAGHPILYARNRLMAERGHLKANERADIILKAWNYSRLGIMGKTHFKASVDTLPSVER